MRLSFASANGCTEQSWSPFVETRILGISTRGQVSFSTNGERLETQPEEEAAKRIVVMNADACTAVRFPENSVYTFPTSQWYG